MLQRPSERECGARVAERREQRRERLQLVRGERLGRVLEVSEEVERGLLELQLESSEGGHAAWRLRERERVKGLRTRSVRAISRLDR